MLKLFALFMVVNHPTEEPTNFVLDYDMAYEDCQQAIEKEWQLYDNPNIIFECVEQVD